MTNKTVAIILTSCANMGDGSTPTGFHYEEMTTPFWIFKDAGCDVILCSIKGGHPSHDPNSLKNVLAENPDSVKRFIESSDAVEALRQTKSISEIQINDIDAVYLAGGHGAMWDFPENPDLSVLLSQAYQQNKPVAAICHGVAGLIGAKDEVGNPIITGKRINSFTNEEEKQVNQQDAVPFLLETALSELGAKFCSNNNFEAHLEVDGCLITGQNPASAEGVAKEVTSKLGM